MQHTSNQYILLLGLDSQEKGVSEKMLAFAPFADPSACEICYFDENNFLKSGVTKRELVNAESLKVKTQFTDLLLIPLKEYMQLQSHDFLQYVKCPLLVVGNPVSQQYNYIFVFDGKPINIEMIRSFSQLYCPAIRDSEITILLIQDDDIALTAKEKELIHYLKKKFSNLGIMAIYSDEHLSEELKRLASFKNIFVISSVEPMSLLLKNNCALDSKENFFPFFTLQKF